MTFSLHFNFEQIAYIFYLTPLLLLFILIIVCRKKLWFQKIKKAFYKLIKPSLSKVFLFFIVLLPSIFLIISDRVFFDAAYFGLAILSCGSAESCRDAGGPSILSMIYVLLVLLIMTWLAVCVIVMIWNFLWKRIK